MRATVEKRVAIIGAGSSGSCAAKYAAENGLVPTVFERAATPGGLWASSAHNKTAVWENLSANISHYSMSFSDLSYPADTPIIPGLKDVYNYLLAFIKEFDLEKYIRTNTKVVSVSQQDETKKWVVKSKSLLNGGDNETTTEIFDYLIVASGLHSKPKMPSFPGIEKFNGTIMHSSNFSLNDERFKEKNVVVVGCSYSGADISANLVKVAKSVTNIFRRPYVVVPRLIRFKSDETRDKPCTFNILPNDFLLFQRKFSAVNNELTATERAEVRANCVSMINPEQADPEKSQDLYYDYYKEGKDLRLSVSNYFYEFVKQKKIVAKKAGIEKFDVDGICLDDGTFVEADVVIMCTGFDVAYNYFDEKIIQELEYDSKDYKMPYLLYKRTFHPKFDNLAMICQSDGLYFGCTELQCKWASLVFSGKKQLPSRDNMVEHISKWRRKRQLDLKLQYPQEFVEALDMLAEEIGILPNFQKLKVENPELYRKLWGNCSTVNSLTLFDESASEEKKKRAMRILNTINEISKKQYKFEDNDETFTPKLSFLSEKFAKLNQNIVVPTQIFQQQF